MKKILLLTLTAVCLSGCVHRPDIEQGNIYHPDQISQLRPGMSEMEVKALLGTPLLDVPFNQNRLEYVYTMQPGNKKGVGKRLMLEFNNGRLVRVKHEDSFMLGK